MPVYPLKSQPLVHLPATIDEMMTNCQAESIEAARFDGERGGGDKPATEAFHCFSRTVIVASI